MTWRLLFTGAQSLAWTVIVLLCVVMAIALCLLLMRYEQRIVSRGIARWLTALRTMTLIWLFIVMLRPVLTSEWDAAETGRVVVAIDVSDSMNTADRHAARAEKLRWAVALGMLDAGVIDPNEDSGVPAGAHAAAGPEASEPPGNARQTETLREQQVAEILDEFNRMPRHEVVRRLLLGRHQRLLDRLAERHALDIRLFAADQSPVAVEELESEAGLPITAVNPDGTDAIALLSQLIGSDEGSAVRAVVLLSDGRQTEPGDPVTEGQRMGALNVPVFTIPIGSRLKPRDVSIASIEAPEAVFINDSAMLNVVLGASGFEGQPLTVILERDGAEVDRQVVTPASDSLHVSFTAPTSETGRFDYTVRVPEQPGELRTENNSREFGFQVVDSKGRVLLVDGDARWELRYLRNLFDRDPQVDASTVVFRQPWLQLLNTTFIERTLPDPAALREQLSETDLMIVGDLEPGQMSEEAWHQIEDAVSRDGLTVVLIPGRRGLRALSESPALASLLPVESPAGRLAEQFLRSPGDGSQSVFHLAAGDQAESLPMFQFADAGHPDASLAILPGHPWVCTGQPRASATVWAWALNPANPAEREAAIVHQYYGFGQVVWMGIDSTWRWRQRTGDSMHHKFWGQLVRWASRNRTAAGNDQVRLSLSDVVVDEGERVDVVARFSQRAAADLVGQPVEVHIAPLDRPESAEPIVVQLLPSEEFPERFSAGLSGLSAGTWTVDLHLAGRNADTAPVRSELVVQPRKSRELANVSCHRELLQQLSLSSGGELLEPWEADRLHELIEPEERSEAALAEHSLWDNWPALMVFFALLMTEWVTRKLNGLP